MYAIRACRADYFPEGCLFVREHFFAGESCRGIVTCAIGKNPCSEKLDAADGFCSCGEEAERK
jgi:hypothetical protein